MSDEVTGGRRDVRLTPPPRIEPVRTASSRRWIFPLAILVVVLATAALVLTREPTPEPASATPAVEPETVTASAANSEVPTPARPTAEVGRPSPPPAPASGDDGRLPVDPVSEDRSDSRSEIREPSRSDEAFGVAMAEGISAIDAGDWQAARDAFTRAAEIRPDSPEPAAGLARLEAATSRVAIEGLFEQARELEGSEAWHRAATAYRAILEIDPTLTSAREGLRAAEVRSLLFDRLTYHLEHPERLSADAVLEEADRLLETARGVTPAGPGHRGQVAALADLLDRVRAPVRVALVSDALTEVTVFQVGRLGAFSRRELELRPGTYTVVGSRAGYRDVRRQLTVAPGGPPEPFEIRCEEKI